MDSTATIGVDDQAAADRAALDAAMARADGREPITRAAPKVTDDGISGERVPEPPKAGRPKARGGKHTLRTVDDEEAWNAPAVNEHVPFPTPVQAAPIIPPRPAASWLPDWTASPAVQEAVAAAQRVRDDKDKAIAELTELARGVSIDPANRDESLVEKMAPKFIAAGKSVADLDAYAVKLRAVRRLEAAQQITDAKALAALEEAKRQAQPEVLDKLRDSYRENVVLPWLALVRAAAKHSAMVDDVRHPTARFSVGNFGLPWGSWSLPLFPADVRFVLPNMIRDGLLAADEVADLLR